jgi:hypothetical protein
LVALEGNSGKNEGRNRNTEASIIPHQR